MQAPPLLPEETYARVCRVAKFDGLSVLIVAGFFALVSATMGDVFGAVVGSLAAGAGAMELHGVAVLHHGERRGMGWLVGSQFSLMAVLLGYCALQLVRVKLPELPPETDALIEMDAAQLGVSKAEFLRLFNRMLYGGFAIITLVYQGGMALYYLRRRNVVAQALTEET